MNALDLPTVTMCDDPACGPDCSRLPAQSLFGITDWLPADADVTKIPAMFRSELALDMATDSSGVAHVTPAAEFTVHKGARHLTDPTMADSVAWTCVYSGPAATRDEALADAPLWTQELSIQRVQAAAAAA